MAWHSWSSEVIQFADVYTWCHEHLDKQDWTFNFHQRFFFKTDQAYTAFMLRWA